MARATKLALQINNALATLLAERGLRASAVAGDFEVEDDCVRFVRADGAESVVYVQVSNSGSPGSYTSISVTLFDETPTGVEGWVVRTIDGVKSHDLKAPRADAGADDPFIMKLAELLVANPQLDPDTGPKQEGVITHPLAPEFFAALSGNEDVAAVRPFNDGDGGAEVDLVDGSWVRLSIGPGCVTAEMDEGSVETVRNERGASFSDAVRVAVRSARADSALFM